MENNRYAEDAQIGSGTSLLRSEIRLGLIEGDSGPRHEKQEVLEFLAAIYRERITQGLCFIPLVVTDATLTFLHREEGGEAMVIFEPALVLVSTRSSEDSLRDGQWQAEIENLAKDLGQRFNQNIVEIAFYRVKEKVFHRIETK